MPDLSGIMQIEVDNRAGLVIQPNFIDKTSGQSQRGSSLTEGQNEVHDMVKGHMNVLQVFYWDPGLETPRATSGWVVVPNCYLTATTGAQRFVVNVTERCARSPARRSSRSAGARRDCHRTGKACLNRPALRLSGGT